MPAELSAQMQAVAEKSNDFSLKYIQAFEEYSKDPNYAVSPFSANINLMMLANATNSSSREEILNVLGYDANQIDDANEYIKYLSKEMVSFDKKAVIKIANSVWIENKSIVLPDFSKAMSEFFNADINEANSNQIAGLVNEWASEKTEGNINEIVDPNAVIKWMFANALYFKADWLNPFVKTDDIVFKNSNGTVKSVPAMKANQSAQSYDGSGYKIYFIKYGNSAFKFGIILPDEGNDLSQAFADISIKGWKEVMSKLIAKGYELTMPKFDVSTSGDIIPVMESLGISHIFTDNADFSKFAQKQFKVNIMNQGATISVDEKGTTVTAVTVSGEKYTANICEPLTIDRPFGFVVIEECSHAILVAVK